MLHALALFLSLAPFGGAVEPSPRPLPDALRAACSRVEWTPDRVKRLVHALPKVETHLHLDGSVSPEMVQRLAREQRYAPLNGLPLEAIARRTVVQKPKDSLGEVLAVFREVYPLLRSPEAVEAVAYDVLASAKRSNVRYAEVRFAPVLQANPATGFTAEAALQAALKGLARGRSELGVDSGLIICLLRPAAFVSRADNEAMLELAIRYKDRGVVGIDLAGNEAAQPLSDYADMFARAKAAGLKLTAHAGETPGSHDIETALAIGVDRLGHATALAGNPALLERVRRSGASIEANLTSNIRTSEVKDYASHPAKEWYRAGLTISLSTDDPGVFGIDLDHEYAVLAGPLGFTPEETATAAWRAIDALFAPETEKRALRSGFETDVRRFLDAESAR